MNRQGHTAAVSTPDTASPVTLLAMPMFFGFFLYMATCCCLGVWLATGTRTHQLSRHANAGETPHDFNGLSDIPNRLHR